MSKETMQEKRSKSEAQIFPPTPLERMIAFLRLPPVLGTILVGLFVGPLGNFLYLYSLSFDPWSALYQTFISTSLQKNGVVETLQSNWYSLAGSVIWFVFLMYAAFLVGYLRNRLVEAEPELKSLAANEEALHRSFRAVTRRIPQLAIIVVFLFAYATSVPELLAKGELTALSTPVFVLRSLIRSVMLGSILWLYSSSLWGLYRFGKLNLRMKSCYEDPMLGVGKLGSLSFLFSTTYFLGLTLFTGQMILSGLVGQTSLVSMLFTLVLVPVGIALFIAPLMSTHGRMLEAKKAETSLTNQRLSELISRIRTNERDDGNIVNLLTLETAERKLVSIRTWPIESPLIGQFTLIAASVAAILIARIVLILLQI